MDANPTFTGHTLAPQPFARPAWWFRALVGVQAWWAGAFLPRMPREDYRRRVIALVDSLPADVRIALGAVQFDVRAKPASIDRHFGVKNGQLAYYSGEPWEADPEDERYYLRALGQQPISLIVIFTEACDKAGPGELEITVLHEIGHALGMDEGDVAELGLA